jgi:hypothetical protein
MESRADDVPCQGAEFTHRRYGRHDDHKPLVTQQAGDFGNSSDVLAAIRLAKPQPLAQAATHVISVEDGNRNTIGHCTQAQTFSDSRFARA